MRLAATSSPWVVANGWRFIRRPGGRFYYDVTGKQAALAAAEAFCYGANAMIRTDAAGLKPLAAMLDFLRTITGEPLPPVADIGYIDDGSAASGEVMNLLVRDNLLFQLVTAPDRRLKLNVKLGTREYPLEDARNPGAVAHAVRFNLTDEKRSVRIYGSQVVVARLTASAGPCAAASVELCGGGSEGGWDSRARARPVPQTPVVAGGRRGRRTARLQRGTRRHRVHASGIEDLCGSRSVAVTLVMRFHFQHVSGLRHELDESGNLNPECPRGASAALSST
jgi:hypothetical protein